MRLAISLLIMLSTAAAFAADGIQVEDPYVRAAPPGARALAAYLHVINSSHEIEVLSRVSSPEFAAAELHSNIMEDSVMKMRRLSSIEIPADGRLSFAPGGLHLMLIDPKKPLVAGDKVHLRLEFASGAVIETVAEVRDMRDQGRPAHQHMHQHQH